MSQKPNCPPARVVVHDRPVPDVPGKDGEYVIDDGFEQPIYAIEGEEPRLDEQRPAGQTSIATK